MASPVVVTRIQNRRGLQSQFDSLYPAGYTGTGGYNPPGTGPAGFTPEAFPDVLLPGEVAFCTDSRRIFMGNVNGEYVELAQSSVAPTTDLNIIPIKVVLVPSPTFVVAPGLTYLPAAATPFITIFYDLTDDIVGDYNVPGINFSRNGLLQITANKYTASPASVTLTDSGSEINNTTLPSSISFMAEYDASHTTIEIKYKHDFPGDLTFSSTALLWKPI